MMTDAAIPMTDSSRNREPKHPSKAWGYPDMDGNPEFAASCGCGFNIAGLKTLEEAEYHAENHWKPDYTKPFQAEILYTSKGEEVETRMTDDEVRDVLVRLVQDADNRGRPNNFASDLVQGFEKYNGWTERQRPWAHKLANDFLDRGKRQQQRRERLSDRTFTELVEMMRNAAMNLKRPKVTAEIEGYGTIQLSIASNRARKPGSINVTDGGPYGESIWYGRILVDEGDFGRFDPGRDNEDWVTDALAEFNEDTAHFAGAHGRRTGNCCFCNRELTTKESTSVGYGPVCADHYGLPWG